MRRRVSVRDMKHIREYRDLFWGPHCLETLFMVHAMTQIKGFCLKVKAYARNFL